MESYSLDLLQFSIKNSENNCNYHYNETIQEESNYIDDSLSKFHSSSNVYYRTTDSFKNNHRNSTSTNNDTLDLNRNSSSVQSTFATVKNNFIYNKKLIVRSKYSSNFNDNNSNDNNAFDKIREEHEKCVNSNAKDTVDIMRTTVADFRKPKELSKVNNNNIKDTKDTNDCDIISTKINSIPFLKLNENSNLNSVNIEDKNNKTLLFSNNCLITFKQINASSRKNLNTNNNEKNIEFPFNDLTFNINKSKLRVDSCNTIANSQFNVTNKFNNANSGLLNIKNQDFISASNINTRNDLLNIKTSNKSNQNKNVSNNNLYSELNMELFGNKHLENIQNDHVSVKIKEKTTNDYNKDNQNTKNININIKNKGSIKEYQAKQEKQDNVSCACNIF